MCSVSGPPSSTYPTSFGSPTTLILFNKQRLDRAYGVTETAKLIPALNNLADSINGVVVPVENNTAVSDTYGLWDNGNACSPEAANDVATGA